MGIIRGWNRALKAIILWFVQKNSVKVNKRIDPTINIGLRKMFGRRHRKPIARNVVLSLLIYEMDVSSGRDARLVRPRDG